MLQSIKRFIFKVCLYLTCIFFISCLIPGSACNALELVWNPNSEVDLKGYKVYYRTSPPDEVNYTSISNLLNLFFEDPNKPNQDLTMDFLGKKFLYLEEKYTYHFVVTAYDYHENESGYSEEEIFDGNDGISDDNCPNYYNPDQEDTFPPDGNGIGDACECEGDFDCDGDVDGVDIRKLRLHFGRSQYQNPCTSENPCLGDFDCDEDIDGVDGRLFKGDFGRSLFSKPCPPCNVADWCSY